ncbi:MAG: alpha/beta fold hydrolase [Kiritimatiellia bacterium]|nr:alpha/beta hydrolase [Lentisphaerota bacterium]
MNRKNSPHHALEDVFGFTSIHHPLPDGRELTSRSRPGKGPALILIPGTWGDLESWTPLITRLPPEQPITVIELFWQGGRPLVDGPLDIPALADAVLQVIAALRQGPFVLGGISLGGMITVEIAGRNPPDMVGAIPMEGWTHHTVVETAFHGLVRTPLEPDRQEEQSAARNRRLAHLSAEQQRLIRTIWKRWNGMDALRRAKAPIIHVWGDRAQPRPGPEALQIPERPNITIAWIAGSSHLLLIQAPDALARTVRDLLIHAGA